MSTEEEVEMWVDPVRTRQVLRNLLTNADRYGGSTVLVHVTKGDGDVAIEVRDDGEGIPDSMRDHVFEPYARAHDSQSQPASIGLGLSVARSLSQLMNGDLVLARDDGWTVFTVTLPGFERDEPPGPPSKLATDERRIVVRV